MPNYTLPLLSFPVVVLAPYFRPYNTFINSFLRFQNSSNEMIIHNEKVNATVYNSCRGQSVKTLFEAIANFINYGILTNFQPALLICSYIR